MTVMKTTYHWFDRNQLGQPIPITRYKREWSEDDGKALGDASDALTITEAEPDAPSPVAGSGTRYPFGINILDTP